MLQKHALFSPISLCFAAAAVTQAARLVLCTPQDGNNNNNNSHLCSEARRGVSAMPSHPLCVMFFFEQAAGAGGQAGLCVFCVCRLPHACPACNMANGRADPKQQAQDVLSTHPSRSLSLIRSLIPSLIVTTVRFLFFAPVLSDACSLLLMRTCTHHQKLNGGVRCNFGNEQHVAESLLPAVCVIHQRHDVTLAAVHMRVRCPQHGGSGCLKPLPARLNLLATTTAELQARHSLACRTLHA